MILDLYDEKLDFIFLQTNFVDIYSTDENFEDIGEKIDVVDTTQKVVTKEEVQLSGRYITTIYNTSNGNRFNSRWIAKCRFI